MHKEKIDTALILNTENHEIALPEYFNSLTVKLQPFTSNEDA